MTRVAFMGDPGSYSHAAALAEGGPGAEPVSCPRFAEVFSAVAQGRADVGVVPVENSEAGPVGEVLDLLLGSALLVCAERVLPIRHALLAPAGRTLAGLRRVHSHPQALAQCRAFIQAHGLEEVPEADTATAARKMSEFRPHASAAIASPAAGVLYGLEVLALGLETNPENATRFLTLGTSARPWRGAAKTLIVFGLGEHPGDLVAALAAFGAQGLKVSHLQTRPRHRKSWETVFFVAVEGHADEAPVQGALAALSKQADLLRVLGSYPRVD